jgi:hypothetical protein
MNSNTPDSNQARQALEDAEARSQSAAARLPENAYWFEALGLVYIGALFPSIILPTPFNVLAIAGLVVVMTLVFNKYQERYGVWVSGFRPGQTRMIAIGLSAVLIALLMTVWILHLSLGLIWPAFAGALVAMSVSFVLGRVWMRAYRRETSSS